MTVHSSRAEKEKKKKKAKALQGTIPEAPLLLWGLLYAFLQKGQCYCIQ